MLPAGVMSTDRRAQLGRCSPPEEPRQRRYPQQGVVCLAVASLHHRAAPIGVALAVTTLAGVIADVVCMAQVLTLGGADVLLLMIWWVRLYRGWNRSLLDWQLKRRKRAASLDF